MAEGVYNLCLRLRSRGPSGQPLVPPELRHRLVTDARERGVSLNGVVVAILAAAHKMPYEPTSPRATPVDEADVLTLALPLTLYRRLTVAAGSRRPPLQVGDEIRATLCAHYALPFTRAARRLTLA